METPHRISAIAAISEITRGLGKGNDLLWKIPEDLKRFRALTSGHPIIMGRKTFESIGRALPNRLNIVVTRKTDLVIQGALVCNSLEEALEKAKKAAGADEIFIIGGGELYKEALPFTDRLYLTLIKANAEADVFFPEYEKEFTKEISKEDGIFGEIKYSWVTLEK